MSDKSQVGKVGWIDITVADGLRDFYKEVVGWSTLLSRMWRRAQRNAQQTAAN